MSEPTTTQPTRARGAAARQRAFLAAFAITGNVSRAAQAAGVTRRLHYNWLEADADYAAAFEGAREEAADALEEEARRRAVDGLRRLKFGRDGQPLIDPATGAPYVEHEYSDTLLLALLRAARPEKYRENVDVKHAGDVRIIYAPTIAELPPPPPDEPPAPPLPALRATVRPVGP